MNASISSESGVSFLSLCWCALRWSGLQWLRSLLIAKSWAHSEGESSHAEGDGTETYSDAGGVVTFNGETTCHWRDGSLFRLCAIRVLYLIVGTAKTRPGGTLLQVIWCSRIERPSQLSHSDLALNRGLAKLVIADNVVIFYNSLCSAVFLLSEREIKCPAGWWNDCVLEEIYAARVNWKLGKPCCWRVPEDISVHLLHGAFELKLPEMAFNIFCRSVVHAPPWLDFLFHDWVECTAECGHGLVGYTHLAVDNLVALWARGSHRLGAYCCCSTSPGLFVAGGKDRGGEDCCDETFHSKFYILILIIFSEARLFIR